MAATAGRPDAFAVSNGLWNECFLAFQVINGPVRAALCGDDSVHGPLPNQWRGGWWRAVAWQHSLTQLQSPSDFQAVFAAARALLEITIDAVLLRHETDAAARMADWEESAKLKQAEGIARFYGGQPAPRDHQEAISFAQRESAAIAARRVARGWVTQTGTRHPDRWTNRNLGDDARKADGFEAGLGLEEIYETKYRQMCWYVHASGAIGLRQLGPAMFPALGGFAFRTCSTLAVKHAKLLLQYSGVWETPFREQTWEDIFERLKETQILTTHAAIFGEDALAAAAAAFDNEADGG